MIQVGNQLSENQNMRYYCMTGHITKVPWPSQNIIQAGVISAKGTAERIWLVLNYPRGLLQLRMVKEYSVLAATIRPSKSISHCASGRPGLQDVSDAPRAALPVSQQNVGQVTRTGGREQGETHPKMCERHLLILKVNFLCLFSSTSCGQGNWAMSHWLRAAN